MELYKDYFGGFCGLLTLSMLRNRSQNIMEMGKEKSTLDRSGLPSAEHKTGQTKVEPVEVVTLPNRSFSVPTETKRLCETKCLCGKVATKKCINNSCGWCCSGGACLRHHRKYRCYLCGKLSPRKCNACANCCTNKTKEHIKKHRNICSLCLNRGCSLNCTSNACGECCDGISCKQHGNRCSLCHHKVAQRSCRSNCCGKCCNDQSCNRHRKINMKKLEASRLSVTSQVKDYPMYDQGSSFQPKQDLVTQQPSTSSAELPYSLDNRAMVHEPSPPVPMLMSLQPTLHPVVMGGKRNNNDLLEEDGDGSGNNFYVQFPQTRVYNEMFLRGMFEPYGGVKHIKRIDVRSACVTLQDDSTFEAYDRIYLDLVMRSQRENPNSIYVAAHGEFINESISETPEQKDTNAIQNTVGNMKSEEECRTGLDDVNGWW